MKATAWANATAPTPARAARSEAERAERGANQMRLCNPMTAAPSATGRQYRPGRRPKRARRPAQIGAGTDTPTPVARGGPLHRSAPSGLFFWTVHGPFSFPQDGKENGGCIPAGQAPLREQTPPWPPRRRPIPPSCGRRICPSVSPARRAAPPSPPAGKFFFEFTNSS